MSSQTLTYAGGAEEIIARWIKRRTPFHINDESIDPTQDLAPLRASLLSESATEPNGKHGIFALKSNMIAPEFSGLSELAFQALRQHSKLRILRTHGEHWRGKNRPVKHQARQGANARHAYKRKADGLEWLAHIDVDEFFWPLERPIAEQTQFIRHTDIT